MATYDLANTTFSKITKGDIINCSYSGGVKSIILPKGTYRLECWGAQGGSYNTSYAAGGKGGYSVGTITLTEETTTLYLYTGGQGSYGSSKTGTTKNGGGFNGGGNADYGGGGGGGATDIRIGKDSLYARVIVAGGGGGAYSYNTTYKAAGGAGGGTSGSNGSYYSSSYTTFVGKGGTATAGGASNTGVTSGNYNGSAGSFGSGGASGQAYSTSYYANGAGGGGWYGGSGADSYNSRSRDRASGGGGGSGYVYTSSTASQYPSGCQLNSSYYLTDASTAAGQRSGNGYITITVIKVSSCPFRVKINDSTWKECQSTWIKIDNSTWKEINNYYFKNNNFIEVGGGGKVEIPEIVSTYVNITNSQNSYTGIIIDGNEYYSTTSNILLQNRTIEFAVVGYVDTPSVKVNGTALKQTSTESYYYIFHYTVPENITKVNITVGGSYGETVTVTTS